MSEKLDFTNYKYKVTTWLIDINSVTYTNDPESLKKQIIKAIEDYHNPKWWSKRKTTFLLTGTPEFTISIDKIQCIKVEKNELYKGLN